MPSDQLWDAEEHDYVTNEIHKRYSLTVETRDELTKRWKRGDQGLNFPVCLAVLNGRVLLMAQELGNSNDASNSLKQCRFFFKEVDRAGNAPFTNNTIADIRAFLENWDRQRYAR